jgi:hypothetical protein
MKIITYKRFPIVYIVHNLLFYYFLYSYMLKSSRVFLEMLRILIRSDLNPRLQ